MSLQLKPFKQTNSLLGALNPLFETLRVGVACALRLRQSRRRAERGVSETERASSILNSQLSTLNSQLMNALLPNPSPMAQI
jgi:hypothetical protein